MLLFASFCFFSHITSKLWVWRSIILFHFWFLSPALFYCPCTQIPPAPQNFHDFVLLRSIGNKWGHIYLYTSFFTESFTLLHFSALNKISARLFQFANLCAVTPILATSSHCKEAHFNRFIIFSLLFFIFLLYDRFRYFQQSLYSSWAGASLVNAWCSNESLYQ